MTAEEIYKSSPLFKCYEFDKFVKYDKKMIELTGSKRLRIEKENCLFHQDHFLFPRNEKTLQGEPFWDTHTADKLLADAVRTGLHISMPPKDLRQTNDEFKEFKLKPFRKHIYQEADAQQ